jgi:hypothetical protein
MWHETFWNKNKGTKEKERQEEERKKIFKVHPILKILILVDPHRFYSEYYGSGLQVSWLFTSNTMKDIKF